jgi:hypothetical protein
MKSRLKAIYDRIHGYLREKSITIIYYRDDIRDLAVIDFQHGADVYQIHMEQDQDYVIVSDLKDKQAITGDDTTEDLFADGWGPTGRENGLCRVCIFKRNEPKSDILDIENPNVAKYAPPEKLPEFDHALAGEAINFLEKLLTG